MLNSYNDNFTHPKISTSLYSLSHLKVTKVQYGLVAEVSLMFRSDENSLLHPEPKCHYFLSFLVITGLFAAQPV